MDTTKAIFERRTIHLFDPIQVHERLILKAVEAANQAPCHKLTFPWRFYSIGKKTRDLILNLAIKVKFKNNQIDVKSLNLLKTKYLNPSHLLVASQKLNDDQLTQKEDYAACSCAIQNLSISLASKGVSMKWSTGSIIRIPEIYEITNIDSNSEEIIGLIWIGYGKKMPMIKRPCIDQIYKNI